MCHNPQRSFRNDAGASLSFYRPHLAIVFRCGSISLKMTTIITTAPISHRLGSSRIALHALLIHVAKLIDSKYLTFLAAADCY